MTAVSTRPSTPESSRKQQPALPALPKKPLPAGRPREWYETHNRQLKAMRIAIALLDTGIYTPRRATDRAIRATATRIGARVPSHTTCRVVRGLLP